MSTQQERLERLRRLNASIKARDAALAEETEDLASFEALRPVVPPEAVDADIEFESIVLRTQRPVLAIRDNVTRLEFVDAADSEIWKARLEHARPLLDDAIRAVGRIELKGSPYDWIGTGWLVSDNVLVSNRHVADEFAMRKGDGFTFRMGASVPMTAAVDFLQEIDNPKALAFKLIRPLHIEESPGPDVSLFEVEIVAGDAKLAKPIRLADRLAVTENVATIGYPAYDSRIPEADLMERIYGKTYNKKRLAPGGVTRVEQARILHNCTTLGGNSGSVVLDLDSGEALGLHFSGTFLTTNYAVRADVVKKILADLRSGRTRKSAPPRPARVGEGRAGPQPISAFGTASVTIPLKITVSIGNASAPYRAPTSFAARSDTSPIVEGQEAVAADYRDRGGYQPNFLGDDFAVTLPSVQRDAADVLEFEADGKSGTELRYEHYSVVMSRSRRMCFFSAVNIDGKQSKKNKRVQWKWDPRIQKSQQIMNECYGDPPRFSRGHMTRREDPGWGADDVAKRGNEDSMHVTNATPQMQAFNAPIWLALEDYALDHAKEDDMKICVFTGPYFDEHDPEMYGVRIPVAFWKIIAFIHDVTGKLCATGYEMTQDQSLRPQEEFVFAAFTSPQLHVATQVAIRAIEARSGLRFGNLASLDPLAGEDEGLGDSGPRPPLLNLDQIRFLG